jgi:Sec-independent protein translocase protein TatA
MKEVRFFILVAVVAILLFPTGCQGERVRELEESLAETQKTLEDARTTLNDCETGRVDGLKKANEEIERLNKELLALNETAQITAEIIPNPIFVDSTGSWRWSVNFTTNQIGVDLQVILRKKYKGDEVVEIKGYDADFINEKLLLGRYLSPGRNVVFRGGFNRQDVDSVGFIIYGIDDNGHFVVSEEVKAELRQEKGGES